mmetsp:Transcript_90613/g.290440  ORF Transcript_90613/g.290440 Transcript_90613/m.290440 type:complete len:89 (+) Transcript_90613:392-658(+)
MRGAEPAGSGRAEEMRQRLAAKAASRAGPRQVLVSNLPTPKTELYSGAEVVELASRSLGASGYPWPCRLCWLCSLDGTCCWRWVLLPT